MGKQDPKALSNREWAAKYPAQERALFWMVHEGYVYAGYNQTRKGSRVRISAPALAALVRQGLATEHPASHGMTHYSPTKAGLERLKD